MNMKLPFNVEFDKSLDDYDQINVGVLPTIKCEEIERSELPNVDINEIVKFKLKCSLTIWPCLQIKLF